jgi:hypothetical protein
VAVIRSVAVLFVILAAMPCSAQVTAFDSKVESNYANYPAFRFWIPMSSGRDCSIDNIKLLKRFYPLVGTYVSPHLEWWSNGQPSGPAIKVIIEEVRTAPNKCMYAVTSDVTVFAKPGGNFPNVSANYLHIGPTFVSASNDRDDQVNEVQTAIIGQLSFFFDLYRSGGSNPKPRP